MTAPKPPVQLYDRDAAIVSAVLTLVAGDIPNNDSTLEALAVSLPAEVCFAKSAPQRHAVAEARVRSIIAAIDEQRGLR